MKFRTQNIDLKPLEMITLPNSLEFHYEALPDVLNCLCNVNHRLTRHANVSKHLNTLRPRQNGRHFADDIFKCIFLNENVWIPIKISLKFVLKGPINNIPSMVQIMAWRRPGEKPLSEPMMVSLPTHICVARPQWVKTFHNRWMPNIINPHSQQYQCSKFCSEIMIIICSWGFIRYLDYESWQLRCYQSWV